MIPPLLPFTAFTHYLTKQGIPTPRGKKKWSVSTIMSILQNEKYKGDALLQKTYVADFLTKRVKKNCGEIPQYYIKDSHPAIIDPATFDLVQKEIERRQPERHKLLRSNPLRQSLSVGTATVITAGRFGTATASTVNTFGVATKNMKKKWPAPLRIWTRRPSKQPSWKRITGCWAIKNSILPGLRKCCRCSLIPVN